MYGSLTNRLNERQASDEIRVGVGATIVSDTLYDKLYDKETLE